MFGLILALRISQWLMRVTVQGTVQISITEGSDQHRGWFQSSLIFLLQ